VVLAPTVAKQTHVDLRFAPCGHIHHSRRMLVPPRRPHNVVSLSANAVDKLAYRRVDDVLREPGTSVEVIGAARFQPSASSHVWGRLTSGGS
jgi:hypothetical protein